MVILALKYYLLEELMKINQKNQLLQICLENQKDIIGLYKRYEFDEMKDILQGWLKPTDEDGGKETEKVQPQGKVDINKKLDNLFD